MFVNFSEETQHLLKQAEKEKDELNHPYVGSEHLFLSILKYSKLSDVLKKHKITYKRFKDRLVSLVGRGSKKSAFLLYTPLLKRVLENSVIEAREENNQIVNPEILIISILDEEDGVAYSILRGLNVNIDKLYFDIRNKRSSRPIKRKKLLLDELGTNLTKMAQEKRLDPVIGRDEEITKTIEILLRRKKNNPILIGPAGVGKTAIVEGIANLMVSERCPKYLKNKKLISLNIFSLVSGTKYRGEFEEKMKTLIKELEENSDIILFIDEIHTMVGAGGAEGAIDASNIFKPALARGMIRIIGATTLDEYKKFIEPDAALARRFQSVVVKEPDKESVVKILKEIKPLYEKYHNIKISDDLLEDIVNLSSRYLSNRFEPDRSIDVLDEVCAKSSISENYQEKRKGILEKRLEQVKKEKIFSISNNDFKRAYDLKNEENKLLDEIGKVKIESKVVTKKDILAVVREKGNVSIAEFGLERRKFYKKLEADLNKEIFGQEMNISKLVRSLMKKDLLADKKCYSVLLVGAKGSGKTYFSEKYLSKLVPKENIIRIDMSEYKEYHTMSKLIGTTAGYLGYDNKNNVFERVRSMPSSALIIDNFDDGCIEVKNLFAKIIECGYAEDGSGKQIDFTNSYLIFTSCLSDDSSLGFGGAVNTKEEVAPEIKDKVWVKIILNKPDDNVLKKIFNDKIDKVILKYKDIKINVDQKYRDALFKKIKEVSKIDDVVENEFESKIIEALINYEERIDFTSYKKTSDISN